LDREDGDSSEDLGGNKEVIELVYIGYMRGVYIGIGHMVES
jgi:hypothetical protein